MCVRGGLNCLWHLALNKFGGTESIKKRAAVRLAVDPPASLEKKDGGGGGEAPAFPSSRSPLVRWKVANFVISFRTNICDHSDVLASQRSGVSSPGAVRCQSPQTVEIRAVLHENKIPACDKIELISALGASPVKTRAADFATQISVNRAAH
jgi:hypothetical protein